MLTRTTKEQRTTNPGLYALVAYIAGGTSHHQPMGVGHMTVLQLRGPMGFRVLQWCHPMLVLAKRTSYCTRMITPHGARKWIQARANIYFDIFSVYLFSEVLASVFLYVTCMLYVFKLLGEKQTKYHLRQSKLGIKSCLKTENSPLTAYILCLFIAHYCSSGPKGAC